ncbi:MAG: CPBP family intramembrane metalloprotease [Flavobacteriales bacterium]|nr:CPBP family intramembrane metalloprotease [Flavobacteriales bacterium]
MVDKRVILSLGLLTLIGFPLLGMAIVKIFSDQPIQIMIRQTAPVWEQFAIGVPVGTLMGLIAHWLTEQPILKPSTRKYARMLGSLRLSTTEKALISVCAGFGEELLFRGAIQYFWGIWITAVFFVAIHGYLNIKDWRISIYGTVMTIFIAIMGYMHEWYGIWAAVAAHVMIDFVLLMRVQDQGPHVPMPEMD